jgi:hypothetical protein
MKRIVARLILVLLAGAAWQAITAGVLEAQQGVPVREGVAVRQGVPEKARAAPSQGVAVQAAREEVVRAEADPEELTDEEIRDLLVKDSIEHFKHFSGRRRSYFNGIECSGFDRLNIRGPPVICDPAEVPAEKVQEYRELQKHLRSTFLTEPTPEFLTQTTPKF